MCEQLFGTCYGDLSMENYIYIMHLPKHSLLFGILLFASLGLLSYCFPEKGWNLGGYGVFHFPSFQTLFGQKHHLTDISGILEAIDDIDTNFTLVQIPENETGLDTISKTPISSDTTLTHTSDTLEKQLKQDSLLASEKEEQPKRLITGIQFKNKKALYAFFSALSQVKSVNSSLRVLHYGDSQIEGDRMTEYLRLKLQAQFGGEGPGLVSFMPVSKSVINTIEFGENWDRYSAYTARDKRVPHNNFGVLAGFCRFHGIKKTGLAPPVVSSASVGITTTPLGGGNALNFKRIKLFYGGAKTKTWCEFYEGPVLMKADSLEAGGNFKVKEYKIVSGANKHSFKFNGLDSPDFYALSLEGNSGVMVDNIALRGSSGTFFQHLNPGQLKLFYEYLNVKLIVLQFGGNVMPSILDQTMAVNYGNYLRYQINLVKKAAPQASILFIGPSDMNIKEGTDYVTYPLLETVRDEIKKAALETGCAFFDLYDCMGGKNSMAAWVDQNLAASDYTHFSPQGARKMAMLLYAALINEYNSYLKNEKNQKDVLK